MKINTSRTAGFTVVNILMGVTIVGLLATVAVSNFVKAGDFDSGLVSLSAFLWPAIRAFVIFEFLLLLYDNVTLTDRPQPGDMVPGKE